MINSRKIDRFLSSLNKAERNFVILRLGYKTIRSNKKEKARNLTPRQLQVLKLICTGKTNREAAKRLKTSAWTVEFHRRGLYKKIKVHNVAQLISWATRNGYIKL